MFDPHARILVAEDEEASLDLYRLRMERFGFLRVDFVETGGEAWNLLQKCEADPYALVISDNKMPQMTGCEILQRMRRSGNSVLETLPFLLVSSTEPWNKLWKEGLGRVEFLEKPASAEDIKAKIEKLLKQ